MSNFIFLLCWLGVAQSLLLSLFFLTQRKNWQGFLLGSIFLMIGLRVIKSTLYLSLVNLPLWMINLGFAAHMTIAPLLFLYLWSITGRRNSYLILSIHFILPIIIIICSRFLTLDGFWYKGGYATLLFYTIIYLIGCWWIYFRYSKTVLTSKSVFILLLGVSLFQVSYFSNYVLQLTPYKAGPVLHTIIIYAMTFFVLKTNIIAQGKKKKYSNLNISEPDLQTYKQKIIIAMSYNHPYLNADFSLSKLSELTGIQAHILSYVFTVSIKQNFQFFINTYRIEQAKDILTDPTKKHLSIAAIANECGFNTISSFNVAFKRITHKTPSEFRNVRAKNSGKLMQLALL